MTVTNNSGLNLGVGLSGQAGGNQHSPKDKLLAFIDSNLPGGELAKARTEKLIEAIQARDPDVKIPIAKKHIEAFLNSNIKTLYLDGIKGQVAGADASAIKEENMEQVEAGVNKIWENFISTNFPFVNEPASAVVEPVEQTAVKPEPLAPAQEAATQREASEPARQVAETFNMALATDEEKINHFAKKIQIFLIKKHFTFIQKESTSDEDFTNNLPEMVAEAVKANMGRIVPVMKALKIPEEDIAALEVRLEHYFTTAYTALAKTDPEARRLLLENKNFIYEVLGTLELLESFETKLPEILAYDPASIEEVLAEAEVSNPSFGTYEPLVLMDDTSVLNEPEDSDLQAQADATAAVAELVSLEESPVAEPEFPAAPVAPAQSTHSWLDNITSTAVSRNSRSNPATDLEEPQSLPFPLARNPEFDPEPSQVAPRISVDTFYEPVPNNIHEAAPGSGRHRIPVLDVSVEDEKTPKSPSDTDLAIKVPSDDEIAAVATEEEIPLEDYEAGFDDPEDGSELNIFNAEGNPSESITRSSIKIENPHAIPLAPLPSPQALPPLPPMPSFAVPSVVEEPTSPPLASPAAIPVAPTAQSPLIEEPSQPVNPIAAIHAARPSLAIDFDDPVEANTTPVFNDDDAPIKPLKKRRAGLWLTGLGLTGAGIAATVFGLSERAKTKKEGPKKLLNNGSDTDPKKGMHVSVKDPKAKNPVGLETTDFPETKPKVDVIKPKTDKPDFNPDEFEAELESKKLTKEELKKLNPILGNLKKLIPILGGLYKAHPEHFSNFDIDVANNAAKAYEALEKSVESGKKAGQLDEANKLEQAMGAVILSVRRKVVAAQEKATRDAKIKAAQKSREAQIEKVQREAEAAKSAEKTAKGPDKAKAKAKTRASLTRLDFIKKINEALKNEEAQRGSASFKAIEKIYIPDASVFEGLRALDDGKDPRITLITTTDSAREKILVAGVVTMKLGKANFKDTKTAADNPYNDKVGGFLSIPQSEIKKLGYVEKSEFKGFLKNPENFVQALFGVRAEKSADAAVPERRTEKAGPGDIKPSKKADLTSYAASNPSIAFKTVFEEDLSLEDIFDGGAKVRMTFTSDKQTPKVIRAKSYDLVIQNDLSFSNSRGEFFIDGEDAVGIQGDYFFAYDPKTKQVYKLKMINVKNTETLQESVRVK